MLFFKISPTIRPPPMATATSSILLQPTISATKAVLPLVSSISISKPRKSNTRKNYLRPKILKTISIPNQSPILPQPPSQIPTIFLPLEKDSNFPSIDQFPKFNDLQIQELDQFQAPESVKIASGKYFLKFGWWFVGAFILQTVCAIWVFNSNDNKVKFQTLDKEDENNSRLSEKVSLSGIDEQIKEKIEEIRVMAREARESERLEREKNGLDGNESDFEDEGEDGSGKSGIEKEVNERLSKLKERLEKSREKVPQRVENLKAGNEGLVFKKKYKFKGGFGDQRDRPKGFSGPSEKDYGKVEESQFDSENEVLRSGGNLGDGSNMLEGDRRLKLDAPDGNGKINVLEDTERMRQERNKDVAEHKYPKVQDRNNGSAVAVTADSRDPSILKTREVTSHQNMNGSSNSLRDGQQLKQSERPKKPHSGSEWWEKLPYVLVILMEQSRDGERVRGLYTLKSSSGAEGELSHIVAFQDRGDATNFCYLLQLYFEDLGDFSIDVVPLSIKELKEATKSNNKRVIVAKKGQLQLFAGQPISEVEVALRSLMEQD